MIVLRSGSNLHTLYGLDSDLGLFAKQSRLSWRTFMWLLSIQVSPRVETATLGVTEMIMSFCVLIIMQPTFFLYSSFIFLYALYYFFFFSSLMRISTLCGTVLLSFEGQRPFCGEKKSPFLKKWFIDARTRQFGVEQSSINLDLRFFIQRSSNATVHLHIFGRFYAYFLFILTTFKWIAMHVSRDFCNFDKKVSIFDRK